MNTGRRMKTRKEKILVLDGAKYSEVNENAVEGMRYRADGSVDEKLNERMERIDSESDYE